MTIEQRPLFSLQAKVSTPQITPDGPYGERRFIPVTGGKFSGERMSGIMLAGGADSQLVRTDGVVEMDVRCSLRTDDDVIVFMKTFGFRHGPAEVFARMAKGEKVDRGEYYFRELVSFEAPKGKYEWLNRLIAIGVGERLPELVILDVFEIL